MATKKTANKVSKKAEINFNFNKPNKSQKRKAQTKIKKLSAGKLALAVVLLIGGAIGGWFGGNTLIKNDCFTLVGKDEITLTVGKSYQDQGVKAIAFGKDVSSTATIETNLTLNPDGTYTSHQVGTYYMVYKVDSIKYNGIFKVQKIRLITFVEESEDTPSTVEVKND